MHTINTIVELERIISECDNLVLYGIGYAGKKIYDFIDSFLELGGHIAYIAVTNNPENKFFMNKPIKVYHGAEQVLVTVTEEKQSEIIEHIFEYNNNTEVVLISNVLLSEIKLFEKTKKSLMGLVSERVYEIGDRYIKHCIPIQQLKFLIMLAEHCNLNCAHCNVFSPLRKEKFVNEKILEADLERLSSLSEKDAYAITLAGGEPLLNPRAIDIAIMVRKYFPYARIHFVTNGLLLMKQEERFFRDCVRNDIEIEITEYPVNFDYEGLKQFLMEKGVFYRTFASRETMNKESYVLRPQDNGSRGSYNWFHCYRVNDCIRLNNGKLFCGKVEDITVLKERFPEETRYIHSTSRDFINIYEVDSVQEIFDFFSKPFPFCRYCNVDRWSENDKWHVSERKAEEWL